MGENKKCTSSEEIDFVEILLNEFKNQNIVIKELTLEGIKNVAKKLDVCV